MRVVVTKEHIRNGLRCSTKSCPIALAVQEVTEDEVSVDWYSIHVTFPDGSIDRYILPHDIRVRLSLFDEKGEMEPFEFTVYPIYYPLRDYPR